MIKVEHLTKKYGDRYAINDVSFEVHDGEVVGFLGSNGAGKTTTMNIITGYLSSTSGSAMIDGKDVLEDSGGAFLAEENPESVKNALLAISNLSEKEKARLGKLNKMYYDSHFSLRTVTDQIEKEFK